VSLFPRILALFVSLAYLVVGTVPCAMSNSLATSATTGARETESVHAQYDSGDAQTHAGHTGHARRDAAKSPGDQHADHNAHEGHAAHARSASDDSAALHERLAEREPTAYLSAPCTCGCNDSPDSTGNSSARVGFALARAGWNRALELDPPQYAATLSGTPPAPLLASDPVPG